LNFFLIPESDSDGDEEEDEYPKVISNEEAKASLNNVRMFITIM